jgi:predicted transcriptional regulator
MLKRHLQTAHVMTPEQYRAKWGLRDDHPLVAPAYSERRSQMAKQLGLGEKMQAARRRVAKRGARKRG